MTLSTKEIGLYKEAHRNWQYRNPERLPTPRMFVRCFEEILKGLAMTLFNFEEEALQYARLQHLSMVCDMVRGTLFTQEEARELANALEGIASKLEEVGHGYGATRVRLQIDSLRDIAGDPSPSS